MVDLTLGEVASATGSTLVVGDPGSRIRGVAIDSRAASDGSLFVCIPGERADGNDFAAGALGSGAAAVVMTREPDEGTMSVARDSGRGVLRAKGDDAEAFLLALASAWRDANPHWTVVGVTGSVGKTTTKEMIAATFAGAMPTHVTQGNHNNLIGVPLTILSASPSDKALVVEMGMDHAGELTALTHAIRPTVAVITNVGTSHIGNLGSREAIAHAKAEIAAGIGTQRDSTSACAPGIVLVSGDDFSGMIEEEHCRPLGVPVIRVGRAGDAVWAEGVTVGDGGLPRFGLSFSDGDSFDATLPVPSTHAVTDMLLAMAVALRAGLDRRASAKAILGMRQVGMRLDVIREDGLPCVIDDSYNASPSSMASGLSALCSLPCEGRRVAVIGEIGELGDDARRLHGYVGAYAAACPVDMLVLVGAEMADEMAEAAKTMGFAGDAIIRVPDAEGACDEVTPLLGPTDTVLVKGSRFVGLDLFVRHVLRRDGEAEG